MKNLILALVAGLVCAACTHATIKQEERTKQDIIRILQPYPPMAMK